MADLTELYPWNPQQSEHEAHIKYSFLQSSMNVSNDAKVKCVIFGELVDWFN